MVNRDASILAIRAWAQGLDSDLVAVAAEKRLKAEDNKNRHLANSAKAAAADDDKGEKDTPAKGGEPFKVAEPKQGRKLSLFEGLAASGLRSLRYALEVHLEEITRLNYFKKNCKMRIKNT